MSPLLFVTGMSTTLMPRVSVWHFIRSKYTVCYHKNNSKLPLIFKPQQNGAKPKEMTEKIGPTTNSEGWERKYRTNMQYLILL
jgi:hypothetical protein